DKLEDASLFIVNTCSVRQKSEDKVYGLGKKVGEVRNLNPNLRVVMAGCMVGSVTGERQRYAFEELKKRTPWVDKYINPSQIKELPLVLSELELVDDWALKALNLQNAVSKKGLTFAPGENAVPNPKHAFVNISVGCDNFCTFCVVPYARGRELSRPQEEIVKEINHLVKVGYSEFTLCGQNVNSWGLPVKKKFEIRSGSDHGLPFAELLRKVHEIEGVRKISFVSSNPFDFTSDLIDALRLPKVSKYLHMAVQSGNNEVLKRMNRRHTIEEFESLILRIRAEIPAIEIGTDIIVGFPGETKEQFGDTVRLCEKMGFAVAYISIYSPRKGTFAERFFSDDVALTEKKRRHACLTKVVEESKQKVNNRIK
ncbi:MiaB/RimO family radical SAM methylthiotransferase, partial [candidate division WWE3 bacterium]|nr:MiaB/RimO family radical SAM methylthiotransferase [candidate division WWE3 bacterium]